jgi:hypothetical protein
VSCPQPSAGAADLLEARERAARAEGELAAEARRSADLQDLVADLRRELAEARKGLGGAGDRGLAPAVGSRPHVNFRARIGRRSRT